MSWIEQLSRTYDACFGQPQFAQRPLAPIDHVEQQAHIEITVDDDGNFVRAEVVEKEGTLIPATEKSAGRTSGPEAHPLCDKLRYVAADYGAEEQHKLYREQLRQWATHSGKSALAAVWRYVERGRVVRDLLQCGVLRQAADGQLENAWREDLSPLARLLPVDPKTKKRDQGNAFVRWRVESALRLESALWKDVELQADWASYNAALPSSMGFCMATGQVAPLAKNHPKRLRHGGDGAKLISANDTGGYTFRGRFESAEEAFGLGSASTQKAHNALRWLIARQATSFGGQTVVAWAVQTAAVLPLLVDSWDLFEQQDATDGAADRVSVPRAPSYGGDAGQHFALRLRKAMLGYSRRLGDNSDVVVMGMDSATPGRMAILFYREFKGARLLEHIERWHSQLSWPQRMGKERKFIGAPAPRDIAEAAYGRRLDDKLRKTTQERLLPCIVDGLPIPRDLASAATARTANRAGLDAWEFDRNLGVACSLHKATHPKENYAMSLEQERTTRDYLYGRLLAVAEEIEGRALWISGQQRETSAARLMQRFADHPCGTWRTLELQLRPYIAQLRVSRPGQIAAWLKLIDAIIGSFRQTDGQSDFLLNRPLSGEFLLGYHCQREALRQPATKNKPDEIEQESSTSEEGEDQ
jgi:CRISPR-associated protein Csd1